MLEKIKETAEFLGRYAEKPIEWGVILGTGLGDLVSEIDASASRTMKSPISLYRPSKDIPGKWSSAIWVANISWP